MCPFCRFKILCGINCKAYQHTPAALVLENGIILQVGSTRYLEQSSRSAPVCVLLLVSAAIELIALGT